LGEAGARQMADTDALPSQKDSETEANSSIADSDDLLLKKMGYKPSLFRGLGAMMNFAFGFTEVAVLASICLTFSVGLALGGPTVLFWGFMANFAFTMVIAHSMAEICSAYPSAGSVYHWAGQLASPDHAPLWSYICGWLNFLGNGAGDASFANGWAQFFSAGIVASGGTALSNSQIVGVSIAILFIWSILNCLRIDSVGWLNNCAAVIQASSIFILFFSMLLLTPSLSSRTYVFTQFINNSNQDDYASPPSRFSDSYVVAAGLTSALFSFAGTFTEDPL
jgi:amino acid transporter